MIGRILGVGLMVCSVLVIGISCNGSVDSSSTLFVPTIPTGKNAITMIAIHGGTFLMGADSSCHTAGDTNYWGDTVHSVILTAFNMSETEVTQEQYLSVMGVNPSSFTGDLTRPVEMVSWYDAVRFCNSLSLITGKTACYDLSNSDSTQWKCDMTQNGYRLPSEAEWEYAAKAGNDSCNYYWGNDTATLNVNSWNLNNSDYFAHPVGTKTANAFGLYDMSGNVWQWCNDWYGTYRSLAQSDPAGATTGDSRTLRGGSWEVIVATSFRSAFRYSDFPASRYYDIGFRIVSRP